MAFYIIRRRMANTRSAKKRVRSSARKRTRNRASRSAVKTLVSRARRLGSEAPAMSTDELRRAVSALDKAAEKGILHRNNASRRKSRLMKALAKLVPSETKTPSTGGKPAAKSGSKQPAKSRGR